MNDLLTTYPVSLHEQGTIKINGMVLQPEGSPLHGTSIVLGGTTLGTLSGPDGSFSLDIPAEGHFTQMKRAPTLIKRSSSPWWKQCLNTHVVIMNL